MCRFSRLLLILVCCASAVAGQGQDPSACELAVSADGNQPANNSLLCIRLKLVEGKVTLAKAAFTASPEFRKRIRQPLPETEQALLEQLRQALQTAERPYRYALGAEELAADNAGMLNDPATQELRTFSGAWETYLNKFIDWVAANDTRLPVEEVLINQAFVRGFGLTEPGVPKAGLFAGLVVAAQTTPLLFDEGEIDRRYDAQAGTMKISVADPISDWADPAQAQILLPDFIGKPAEVAETAEEQQRRAARVRRLQRELQPLAGTLFCPKCYEDRLRDFYQRLGLAMEVQGLPQALPFITIGNAKAPLTITIIEAPRIARIVLEPEAVAPKEIDKVLYNLLDDAAFRAYVRNRDPIMASLPEDASHLTWRSFNFQDNLHRAGPYLNLVKLQIQQLQLAQLGYLASYEIGEADSTRRVNVNLLVRRLPPQPETVKENTPDAAPPLADEAGVVRPQAQQQENKTDFDPASPADRRVKEKNLFLGGGFEYLPGQGVRFFGLVQRSRLISPLADGSVIDLSLKAGGQQGAGALGAGNFFADYIFFNQLHRRLSVQFSVASDVQAKRALADSPAEDLLTDERRSTGQLRVEFEPFRDLGGRLLRFHLEARHVTVELNPETQSAALTVSKQNLNTLEWGALYLSETSEVELPRRLRLEPLMKFGLGAAAKEPQFRKFSLRGNFHQMLPRRWELDVSGVVAQASENTPLVELPSFGGEDVVRGFRRDDALGRRLWSLQNELWLPLPLNKETQNSVKRLLREKVKLAPFVDVGGVYETHTSTPGTRAGVGAGLRIIYNPIVFKVDYAYGFGTAGTGGSRGKFYFTITTNLPF